MARNAAHAHLVIDDQHAGRVAGSLRSDVGVVLAPRLMDSELSRKHATAVGGKYRCGLGLLTVVSRSPFTLERG
jgi:hypothetical protein